MLHNYVDLNFVFVKHTYIIIYTLTEGHIFTQKRSMFQHTSIQSKLKLRNCTWTE